MIPTTLIMPVKEVRLVLAAARVAMETLDAWSLPRAVAVVEVEQPCSRTTSRMV